MESVPTPELLRCYAADGSNDAFMELMRRYMDLVYAAALRRLNGDTGLAQDVVQRVFLELAGHARKLRQESALGGWLFTRAVRIAADVHKSEVRRRAREHVAAATMAMAGAGNAAGTGEWSAATPHLEDAIGRLSPVDRDAVVLRFIEDRSLRSVGAALGVSEDAAQKRISRALDKLRRQLVRRGVACTAGGLAMTLTGRSASAAPGDIFRQIAEHFQPSAAAAAAGVAVKKNLAAFLFHAIAMKPAAIATVAVIAAVGVAIPFLIPREDRNPRRRGGMAGEHAGPRSGAAAVEEDAPKLDAVRREVIPGRMPPPVALLPGMTMEEREAMLKSARARAEKATMDRYQDKMERLRRKLKLTPEQDAAVSAHHLEGRNRWVEYLTGAAVGEADPKYYHLEVACRRDIPQAIADTFSEEQKQLLAEHEANRRANYLEATTNGELGQLALKLDLQESEKEAIFQKLSAINSTDLFEDYTGIADLKGVAEQADRDLGRRREAFSEVLDEVQMRQWEAVASNYRAGLLKRFGYREPEAAANVKTTNGGAG